MVTLPGGIRVALEFDIQGKVVVNIYHVTTTDPIITVKLLQVAQLFADWWTADLSLQFSEEIALTSVTALDISIENGEKQVLPITPPEPGQQVTGALPNNVAYVVSLRTAKTGRSFMGRTYLCGFEHTAITENEISSAKAAAVVSDFNSLLSGLITISSLLVVASFVSDGAPRVIGVATEVDSIAMNLRVDTQRRRLPA